MAGEGSDEELADARETLDTGGGPPVAGGSTAAGGKPVSELKLKLKKKRAAVKGWVTRAKNNALVLLESREKSKVVITLALEDIDKRLKQLETIQSDYELELEEEDFEGEIEAMDKYLKEVLRTKAKLIEWLESLDQPDDSW